MKIYIASIANQLVTVTRYPAKIRRAKTPTVNPKANTLRRGTST